MDILYIFLIIYASIATITAFVMGFQVFVEICFWARLESWKLNVFEWILSVFACCVAGMICGVLFPLVWYQKISGE